MRILSIRGENLASLAGEFALELDRPPLASQGLIAVTGPTGAGKSTLLDALCLALFDRTPRLRGRGGTAVGWALEEDQGELTSADPRSLIRRGASQARAEVEFLGKGGRRYRAIWRARRARRQATGRLQDQSLELLDVETGRALGGHRKLDTLRAIEEALGLDWEGFLRAVLLAQGEFAAFLQADPARRAELLERVTGTALYSRISAAAHRRAGDAARELKALLARKEQLAPLPPEVRRALVAARDQARTERGEARAAREAARDALHRHRELAEAREEEATAATALAEAEAAWTAGAALREELTERARLELVRGPLQELDRAGAAAAREVQLARGSTAAAEEAAARSAAASRSADEVEAARVTGLARAKGLAPELARARRAVEARARALESRDVAAAARQEAASLLAAAREAAAGAEAERAALLARADEARRWLAANGRLRTLGEQWPRWESLLRTCASAAARLHELRAASPAREERTREARERLARAAGQSDLATREVERATAAAEEARGEGAAAALGATLARDGAGEGRAALRARERLLARLAPLAEEAGRAAAAEAAAIATADAAGEELARSEQALAEARAREPALLARKDEAGRGLEAVRSALALEARRSELAPGQPCPLCGAEEHPWADAAPPLHGLLREAAARLEAIEQELRARSAAEGAAASAAAAARARREGAASAARAAASELAAARRRWSAIGPSQPGWQLPADPLGAGPAVSTAAAQLGSELAALEAAEARLQAAEETLEAARRQEREALGAREASEAALREAEADQSELARALVGEEERFGRAEDELAEALGPLELGEFSERSGGTRRVRGSASRSRPPGSSRAGSAFRPAPERAQELGVRPAEEPLLFSGSWRRELRRDAPAVLRARRAEAEAWRARSDALREAEQELLAGEGQAQAAAARAEEREAQDRRAEAELARREGELEARTRAVAGLLGGRDPEEVATELEAERAALEERAAAARAAAAEARTEAAATAAAAVAATSARDAAARELARAEQALALALAQAMPGQAGSLELARVRRVLDRDASWVARAQGELAGLERRRQEAATRLELLRDRGAELARRAPPGSPVEAEARLHQASEREGRAEELLLRAETDLARDQRVQEELAALLPEVAALEARAGTWVALSEVIGSHDGRKLRVFAQGLGLDALLEQANEYLLRLAPRYRLLRAPGQDLELQLLDRDLGDEVRPTSGLSGGESFLVSLALALGLSSLHAGGTRIESLFVDEGLGSLDPSAQEQALATLDALQADGRQVVLITHLPGIAERLGAGVRVVPQAQGTSQVRVG